MPYNLGMALTPTEEKLYTRQIMIPGWGPETQLKLKASTVFVAGAGGLGSPVSIYLAVAGVGHIRICDFDSPELSNLNRQILHDPSRIGVNKATSGRQTLERINPNIQVTDLQEKITEESVDRLVGDSQLILDCMDNFPTRFVLNDCAIRKGIPLIHASIRGLEGRLGVFHAPETACLRCLVAEAPAKEVFPVVGVVPGVVGTLQALEALKCLTGLGSPLKGKLLVWDGEYCDFQTLRIRRDPNCPSCRSLHS